MNALKLLKHQHREVKALFKQFDESEDPEEKRACFAEIGDELAIHASIEERFFYPAVRARQTEENLEESYDEHLEIKKLLVDCMRSTDAPGFDGKVAALKGAVEHHVAEEQDELFPKVRRLLDADTLEAIGQLMEAEAATLIEAGEPRKNVKVALEPPQPNV